MLTPEAVVAEARTWLGTPFRHQGRLKHVAVDCIGLVIEVARTCGHFEACGLPPGFDIRDYAAVPGTFRMMERFTDYCLAIPLAQAEPGHIAVFAVRGIASHCGILAPHPGGGLSLIHALEAHVPSRRAGPGRRSVIEHRFIGTWQQACLKVFTMPNKAPNKNG